MTVDLVRAGSGNGALGFFTKTKRLNVLLSRQIMHLFVIGDATCIKVESNTVTTADTEADANEADPAMVTPNDDRTMGDRFDEEIVGRRNIASQLFRLRYRYPILGSEIRTALWQAGQQGQPQGQQQYVQRSQSQDGPQYGQQGQPQGPQQYDQRSRSQDGPQAGLQDVQTSTTAAGTTDFSQGRKGENMTVDFVGATRTMHAADDLDQEMPVQKVYLKVKPSDITIKARLKALDKHRFRNNEETEFEQERRLLTGRDLSVTQTVDLLGGIPKETVNEIIAPLSSSQKACIRTHCRNVHNGVNLIIGR